MRFASALLVLRNLILLCSTLKFAPDTSGRTRLQGRTALPGPPHYEVVEYFGTRFFRTLLVLPSLIVPLGASS